MDTLELAVKKVEIRKIITHSGDPGKILQQGL